MSRAMEKMTTSSMPPSASSEQLSKIDETLRVLIDTLMNQSKRLTAIEKAQSDLARTLSSKPSTSETSELDSLRSSVNEIVKTMNAHSETLSARAETVSDKRVVKTSDGSSVSASELQAHSMMKQLSSNLTKTTSALGELKHVVGNGRTVRVDIDRLSAHTVRVLDLRLSQAVEAPIKRVESTLEGFEHRVASLGADKISEAAQRLNQTLAKAEEVVTTVSRTERRLEALKGYLTWTTVGRICLALVPLAMVLVILGGLTMGAFYALGFGPLLGWAWGSFEAATSWWAKGLIALATLGGVAGFAAVVWRLGERLREEFGTW